MIFRKNTQLYLNSKPIIVPALRQVSHEINVYNIHLLQ